MDTFKSRRHTAFFVYWLALVLAALPAFAKEKDYRSPATRAKAEVTYLEQDHTIRRALSLGRATGALSTAQVESIYKALEEKKEVPSAVANTWQKLLRISQTQTYFYDNKHFFPVGYEFETIHPGHVSSEEWKKGAKQFEQLLGETLGVKTSRTLKDTAVMKDDAKREWKLVQEFVRPEEWVAGGYEFVSPPIMDAGELNDLATVAWRLGEKPFGKSNRMTGGHQTFTAVPMGETADAKMMGRVAANMQLLQAQFAPALFDILDIQRDGGVKGNNGPKNFFMRPIVMDHQELLKDLANLDPDKVELKDVRKLFFEGKHASKEFERTIRMRHEVQETIDKAEFDELMKTPEAKRGELDRLWKYRDFQVKYNLKDPAKTLMETRIGDWVHDRPEQSMLKTLVYEQMFSKAWELAKEGKIYQPDIPDRLAKETDEAYWAKLQKNTAASKENFLKTIGITDPERANMILGKAFQVKDNGFKAVGKPSFGFEIEGWTDDLVDVIVPNDPAVRLKWDGMSHAKKLSHLEKMGITIGEYSYKASRRLATEFKVDTARFPFMSPDIIIEDSGNWEIMSHGRNIYDKETLENAIKSVSGKMKDGFGLHIHRFTPDSGLEHVKDAPRKFSRMMERMSTSMALEAYAEADIKEPHHAFDSWSLDRYSPAEIETMEQHIRGNAKIEGAAVKGFKYHNVAYRPVRGGLDIEVRDLEDDVNAGIRHVGTLGEAIDSGNFGPAGAEKSSSLFMEFRDHADPYGKETKRYTILDAVESRHKLTEQQKQLLHKFQFEVYKPSMPSYMFFVNPETPSSPFWDYNEIDAKYLDPKMARANFENNLALPLLDYDGQTYLSEADRAKLKAGKEAFADRLFAILQQVEKDPKYKFLLEDDNFLYLCDYLKRSEHADAKAIPFKKVNAKEAARRQEALEELTYRLRGESVRFVKDTQANQMVAKSIPYATKKAAAAACPAFYKAIAKGLKD